MFTSVLSLPVQPSTRLFVPQMINSALLANRRGIARLQLHLREDVLQKESVLRLRWQDRCVTWTSGRVCQEVERIRYVSSLAAVTSAEKNSRKNSAGSHFVLFGCGRIMNKIARNHLPRAKSLGAQICCYHRTDYSANENSAACRNLRGLPKKRVTYEICLKTTMIYDTVATPELLWRVSWRAVSLQSVSPDCSTHHSYVWSWSEGPV